MVVCGSEARCKCGRAGSRLARQSITSHGATLPMECVELFTVHSGVGEIVPRKHCNSRLRTQVFEGHTGSASESLAAIQNEGYRSLIRQFHIHHRLKHSGLHENT